MQTPGNGSGAVCHRHLIVEKWMPAMYLSNATALVFHQGRSHAIGSTMILLWSFFARRRIFAASFHAAIIASMIGK